MSEGPAPAHQPTAPREPDSHQAAAGVCPTAPAHLPLTHYHGMGGGQSSDHWSLRAHSSPQVGNRESRSRTYSEKASGHQSFKADRGRSGEKEAVGCGKIVPSLPHPVIPPWPSLAYWVAAGSQASVAGLLALRIPAPPLHPEPLWGLGHPASGSVETAVSHSPRRKSPPSTSPSLTPATPSPPLASLFPPWGLSMCPHRGPSGLPALLEPLALPTLLSPTQ